MSSARKRAAIQKANNEADFLRQRLMRAEHHGAVLEAFARAAAARSDEAMKALRYLMERYDAETWQCPACGHAEDTATMDSAGWLREWLRLHNV